MKTTNSSEEDSIQAPSTEKDFEKIFLDVKSSHLKVNFNRRLPKPGLINVDISGYNKVLEFDCKENMITVQSGITVGALSDLLRKRGYVLPIENSANRGSTVAEAFMRGDPSMFNNLPHSKHMVLGTRMLFPGPKVCNIGGKFIKNVTGYDLNKLFFASRFAFCFPLSLIIRVYREEKYSSEMTFLANDYADVKKFSNLIRDLSPDMFNTYDRGGCIYIKLIVKSEDLTSLRRKRNHILEEVSKLKTTKIEIPNMEIRGHWYEMRINSRYDDVDRVIANAKSIIGPCTVYSHFFMGEVFIRSGAVGNEESMVSRIRKELPGSNFILNDSNYLDFRFEISSLNDAENLLLRKLKKKLDGEGVLA